MDSTPPMARADSAPEPAAPPLHAAAPNAMPVDEERGEAGLLLETALFKQVPPREAAQLIPHMESHVYLKGDFIFRQGDPDRTMHVIESGRVKLTRQSEDGRLQLLSISTAGEILGEIPVFDPDGGPRTANAVAMTDDVVTASLERDVLFAWLDDHPTVAVDMLQVLAHRMRLNNERISDLVFMDVPGRLAKTIIDLANRFGRPTAEGITVTHDLTQEELAQLVGSSRETVNKALTSFAALGWISWQRRTIIIHQPGQLIRRARG